MALTISPTLTSLTCTAGEAIVFSFQPQSAAGVPESLTGRAFVFAVWDGNGNTVTYSDGKIVTGTDGNQSALWVLDGTNSRSYFGQTLKFGVYERLHNGFDQIGIGKITVTESAPRVDDLATAPVAHYISQIVRMNDPATIDAPVFKVVIMAYGAVTTSNVYSLDFSQAKNASYQMLV